MIQKITCFLFLIPILTIFQIQTVQATESYTGTWRGTGVLSNSMGEAWYCEDIKIVVEQKADKFEFGRTIYGCGGYDFTFVPPVLKIKGNHAIWNKNGEKLVDVGTFDSQNVNFKFPLYYEGDFGVYTVVRKGDSMEYRDEQIYPHKTITIKANLIKQN